ncbi:MAG: DUF3391 domain-containing protein [Rhodoferax sp.]
MAESDSELIPLDRLRIGHYIELDLGWLAHPFPTNAFKITTQRQLQTVKGLGLHQVRIVPSKSDPAADPVPEAKSPVAAGQSQARSDSADADKARARQQLLSRQRQSLAECERLFGDAMRAYRQALAHVEDQPETARTQCEAVVASHVVTMLEGGESAIRLLSDNMGDRGALHPVNVSVLSLLLGRQLGLAQDELHTLGLAAMLHDLGKAALPERLRWPEENFTGPEMRAYQEHVQHGVRLGKRMGLSEPVLQAIAQHHELMDGSGFPARLSGQALTPLARIVGLINRYDEFCNPSRPALAVTPHEALAVLYAQYRTRYDAAMLQVFIRMMGVYPPGSVVQLTDGRYALVESVNSARPLKPCVTVYDPAVAPDQALLLNLEHDSKLGIARSLKPLALPRAALDYLSPRKRICYFFERALSTSEVPL